MKKTKRFEKVVEWDLTTWRGGNKIRDNKILIWSLIMMIPIIGQFFFFSFLFQALEKRKTYYQEIK